MNSFLQVLSGQKPKETPIWLMRQAGRFLPEYRALRGSVPGFMDAVLNPTMAAEITLQPLKRFPQIDAAILFSDILVIPYALGQSLAFVKGEGPQLGPLITGPYDPKKLEPVIETLRLVKKNVAPGKSVIGFAGGPFTVACYMVAGRNDGFAGVVSMAANDPQKFGSVIDAITNATIDYLLRQIEAGADAIQIFESWSNLLAEDAAEFDRWVITPTKKIVSALKAKYPNIPVIGFPREGGEQIIPYARDTGVNAIGLDYNVDLEWVDKTLPAGFPVQGNLSPEILVEGGDALRDAAKNILRALENRPHIFNLGHGVVPQTPPEHVGELLKIVKA